MYACSTAGTAQRTHPEGAPEDGDEDRAFLWHSAD
jgi:hypothetical protein